MQVSSVVIHAGERFDIVLNANAEVIGNYYLRANGIARCSRGDTFQTAIIHYTGAPDELPEMPDDYETGLVGGIVSNRLQKNSIREIFCKQVVL